MGKNALYEVKSICVQCGSSVGADENYKISAYNFGALLANLKIRLVYGGSNVGLMGAIARGCLENGGEAIAIIPESIKSMVEMLEVTELYVVDSMHERKAMMNDLADAFIAMPGGFGTLEEMFEVITWNQLHLISKPIGLFNINNYYDKLMEFLNHSVECGFIRREHLEMVHCDSDINNILKKFGDYKPVIINKWWD